VRIENNVGLRAGALLFSGGGNYVSLTGCNIAGNHCTDPNWAAAISIDTGVAEDIGTPYDSIAIRYLRLNKVRIYNPLPDGTRQTEIRIRNRFTWTTPKPGIFYSEGCWLGDSDTTGLIKMEAGTAFSMPNWSVAHWFCIPTGSGKSNVVAQMRLNTGAALPASSLKTLEGKFSATVGSFSAGTVPINTSNEMISNYTIPSSPFVVTASVDADTFHPDLKELSIKTIGFEQVKVYPNPATDVIYVSEAEDGSTLTLTDVMGRIVVQQTVTGNNSSLHVNHLAQGAYGLTIHTKTGRAGTVKILKE
jgi:hypothetical protein